MRRKGKRERSSRKSRGGKGHSIAYIPDVVSGYTVRVDAGRRKFNRATGWVEKLKDGGLIGNLARGDKRLTYTSPLISFFKH